MEIPAQRAYLLVICLAASSWHCALSAKDKSTHLPAAVLSAKSVCLDYRLSTLDEPPFMYLVRQRLQKWGRFRVLRPKDNADLVLIFDANGTDQFSLTVMDGSYHRVLWAIRTYAGPIPGRGAELIDLFRRQIESDEKSLSKVSQSAKAP